VMRSEEILQRIGLKYFERNGMLVNVAYGREVATAKEIERDKDSIIIQQTSNESITRDLDTLATFVIRRKNRMGQEVIIPVHVPPQATVPNP